MIGYLRTLLLFYRRHLRVQPWRELMAVAGVAAGVALLFTVQVAHHSITGSFEQISQGVAGRATLELAARGPEGFNGGVAGEVERLPDVKAAAPIFQAPVIAVGPLGRRALTLVGATEQIGSLGGQIAVQFEHAGATSSSGFLVLTEATASAIGARRGREVTILVGERREHLALAATVGSGKLGAAANSPVAAAPLPIVQALAGHQGSVTRVLIEPRPGREQALAAALTARFGSRLNVRTVGTEAKLLGNAAGTEAQVTLLFSAISLVAGIILAYAALLLASEERRRFVVHLIAIGTSDSMIIASLAFDALILGVLGCALGLIAGDVVSLLAYREIPGYIAAAFAIGGQRVIGVQTIAVALAGGMLAALVATALPALAILRGGAAAEPEAVGRALSIARRLRPADAIPFSVGALIVAISAGISALMPGSTVVALLTFAVGLVICLPVATRSLLELGARASRHLDDPAIRLSVAEMRRAPMRSVSLVATGLIAVFLTVMIGGSVADVRRAARSGAGDLLSSANLWVKPGGPENVYTTQPFAYRDTLNRLQTVKGVSSALVWRDSFLDLPKRRVWVLGVPPQLGAQVLPSQLVHGSLALADRHLREGGWVALSQPIAHERHLRLGQRFELPTPSGPATFRLAATTANYGWLPGVIVMNGDDHARLWGEASASQLAVSLEPGVSLPQGRRALEAALPAGSALVVESSDERRSEVTAVLGSTLSRLNDITVVVLVATIASVIALIVAAISQRRGRFDSLLSIGMSFGQLARLIFYESGAVLLAGCAIGMAAGIVGQALIDGWLRHTTGASVGFAPAWSLALRTIAIAGVISLTASMLAAMRTTGLQARTAFASD